MQPFSVLLLRNKMPRITGVEKARKRYITTFQTMRYAVMKGKYTLTNCPLQYQANVYSFNKWTFM